MKIRYATNRVIVANAEDPFHPTFTADMQKGGGITYGTCEINMPSREDEQSYWNPKKAKLVAAYIYNGSDEDYFKELSKAYTSKDILLYIHGFNNTFEDVILQAGRLKRDLDFPGEAMAFSWTSKGSALRYPYDQEMAEKSVDTLYKVLVKTMKTAQDNGGKVSLVVHSLGNRITAMAMQKLEHDKVYQDLLAKGKPIAVTIFSAPDVDINYFGSVLPTATKWSDMVSFYWSSKDRALKFSNDIHEMVRAGLHPLFNDNVDTVNVDKTKSWFSMGHAYYSQSDPVVLDLLLQFKYGRRAWLRHPPLVRDLDTENKLFFKHWILSPS